MRQTWADFMKCVRPEFLHPHCTEDIHFWLVKHTEEWEVKFGDLESRFEARANEQVLQEPAWRLHQTPDGPV